MWKIRTDLAIENREIYRKAEKIEEEIPGIITEFQKVSKDVKVTKVEVISKEGERALGKPMGKYYTLEAENLSLGIDSLNQQVEEAMETILKEVLQLKEEDSVLVVGLGNENVTPDSLGPKVVSQIEITRHLLQYTPQYLKEGTRAVSAIIPGVMGTTGIETVKIIQAIVERVRPQKIIVIDALAARNMKRIKNTIQVTDAGITPGAGVGNHREKINRETLGIPVIALGVPTVVDAKTIVNDVIEELIESHQLTTKTQEEYEHLLQEKWPEIEENGMVTPNEIDEVITNISQIIANSINGTLQEKMS